MSKGPGYGSYVVLLECRQPGTFAVGRLGEMTTQTGFYAYIGSAMGPGGIRARVAHHAGISRRPHWHIDYLRAHTVFHGAWALESADRKECEWASVFATSPQARLALKGFGASDCGCASHLYFMPSYSQLAEVLQVLKSRDSGLAELAVAAPEYGVT